jgi:hypothetical protein
MRKRGDGELSPSSNRWVGDDDRRPLRITLALVFFLSIRPVAAGECRVWRSEIVDGRAKAQIMAPRQGERLAVVLISAATAGPAAEFELVARRSVGATSRPPRCETESAFESIAPLSASRVERGIAQSSRTTPGAKPEPRARRSFYLPVRSRGPAQTQVFELIDGNLAAFDDVSEVYLDIADGTGVRRELFDQIVRSLREEILPQVAAMIGPIHDVDADGRLAVVVSSRLDRVGGVGESVEGCTRGSDFATEIESPLSNRSDCFYVNPAISDLARLRTILAHESAHAAFYCRKSIDRAGKRVGPEEEAWLDEAIAYAIEDRLAISRSNLDPRIESFRTDSGRFSVVIADYHSAGIFRSDGHRGATHLFLKHVLDRSDSDTLKRLATSREVGVKNIEAATGRSFAEWLNEWAIAESVRMLEAGSERGMRVLNREVDHRESRIRASLATSTFVPIELCGFAGEVIEVEVAAPRSAGVRLSVLRPAPAPSQVVGGNSTSGSVGNP